VRFDVAVDALGQLGRKSGTGTGQQASAVWPHTCSWVELATAVTDLDGRRELLLETG
jgi:hypothetical protein